MYDAEWFHSNAGLEIDGPNPDSIQLKDYDSAIWNKYWNKKEGTRKTLSLENIGRVQVSTCKDLAFKADIMELYRSCYGGVPDNGYIGKKFCMAATMYFRGDPKVKFNWAAFAAKITADRIKKCKCPSSNSRPLDLLS